MSEQQSQQTATAVQQRPAPEGYSSWPDYWEARGMPWRTEPEVEQERQRYLAERRGIEPNIEKGLYPFREEKGGIRLDRADVEWLLATHEHGRGPVWWEEERDKSENERREGLDARGADLRGVLRGGLTHQQRRKSTHVQRHRAAVLLERANLDQAHLEQAALGRVRLDGANLEYAHLQQADLGGAHLEHASLRRANLTGAYLRRVFVDKATNLDEVVIGDDRLGFIIIVDASWGDANLSTIDWARVRVLGDETRARKPTEADEAGMDRQKSRAKRIGDYEDAARANRQLAIALGNQGLKEQADRFAYRAQRCQRMVLRRRHRPLRYLGSLALDLIAGYGYKPRRSFITYLLVVGAFAVVYQLLATFGLTDEAKNFTAWDSPLVLSVTSFHGRVFFAGGLPLGDWVARVGAIEAVFGLLIEITFIATFTQRFFAR